MFQHGDLQIAVFTDPMFGQNGYLLWRKGHPDAWIIDPGLPPEPEEIAEAIHRHKLRPVAIVVTHGHADHIAGIAPLRRIYPGVPIVCPRGEAELLVSAEANLSAAMGLPITAPRPDRLLDAGDTIELAGLKFEARDVSGHSPSGMAYYSAAENGSDGGGVLISGDAVFAESIGRYDFPHSSRERLIRNIRDNVLTLPDETMVYSGHGPPATVGQIRRHNEVLRWELEQPA